MTEYDDERPARRARRSIFPGRPSCRCWSRSRSRASSSDSTLSWWFSIVGVVLFVITDGIWIRDTRRDIDELPEEHHTH